MDVISEIRRLPTLSKTELIELWQQYFHNTPVCIRKEYYVRQIAHRLQELTYGGLDSSVKEKIEHIANLNKNAMKGLPLPGTRLIKEYKGIEYTVTVHNDEFEYLGIIRQFKSEDESIQKNAPDNNYVCSCIRCEDEILVLTATNSTNLNLYRTKDFNAYELILSNITSNALGSKLQLVYL